MSRIFKIVFICILMAIPFTAFSINSVAGDFDMDLPGIQLIVNGEKINVQSLPQNGFVEVFNILGTKVMSFQVNDGRSTARINLPKGYYILKSDDVTRKIVVK